MKKLLIISAMLVIALSLNAQSHNRSRSSREAKSNQEKVRSARTPEKKATKTVKPERKSSSSVRHNRSSTPERKVSPAPRRTERQASPAPRTREKSSVNRGRSKRPAIDNNRQSNRSAVQRPERREVTPGVRNNRTEQSTTRRSHESGSVNKGRSANSYDPKNREYQSGQNNPGSRSARSVRSNTYDPKTGVVYKERRRTYQTHHPRRVVRKVPGIDYVPRSIQYKKRYYYHRIPPRVNIVWNINMYRTYRRYYPHFELWYYPMGYRINTISAFEADAYIGEVARVYGKIYESWYSRKNDEYYLYIGGPFPYQDFTIILDGRDARKYSWSPHRYFTDRYISVTGLISSFDGKPEMIIKNRSQIELYN